MRPVEVQAKRGLQPQKCVAAFQAIRDRLPAAEHATVILMVDQKASATVREGLATDLDRLRDARTDGLKPLTEKLIDKLGDAATRVMGCVHVRQLDIIRASDAGTAHALALLRDTALATALESFRSAPGDADINRAFASVAFRSKSSPVLFDAVAAARAATEREGGKTRSSRLRRRCERKAAR